MSSDRIMALSAKLNETEIYVIVVHTVRTCFMFFLMLL